MATKKTKRNAPETAGVFVPLTAADAAALEVLSKKALRSPENQLKWLMRREMEKDSEAFQAYKSAESMEGVREGLAGLGEALEGED